jgi:PadR family transcriptional regulator, regulatory protein AphA
MKRTNKTQYVILGYLSLRPMTGYDIKKALLSPARNFWSESFGQIYPTLAKLLKNKLVTVENEPVGLRVRKVFTITKLGNVELVKWLEKFPEEATLRNELLLKLFFGKNISPERCIEFLTKTQNGAKEFSEYLSKIEQRLIKGTPNDAEPDLPGAFVPDDVYKLIVVRYGAIYSSAIQKWTEEAISILEKEKTKQK